MRLLPLLLVAVAGALLLVRDTSGPAATPGPAEPAAAVAAFAKVPLGFAPNRGQSDPATLFEAKGPGYAFGFSRGGVSLEFSKGERATGLRLRFVDGSAGARLVAIDRLPGKVNYIGGSAATTHTGLPSFAELRYREVWPGIDMYARGERGALKYEFHVRPGADPTDIGLAYAGAQALTTAPDGGLRVHTELGVLRDRPPVSYQVVDGKRVPVRSNFALRGDSGYGFAVGSHDSALPLVIDPGLVYSTYLGEQTIGGGDIAVDPQGNAYLAGSTISANFPTTPGSFDTTFGANHDAYVTKLNKAGTALVYSTFVGGSQDDYANAIAVDPAGNAYVTGRTGTTDFPTTPGAYDSNSSPGRVYAVKLNASGSALDYAAFLASTNSLSGPAIAVDPSGSAYITALCHNQIPTTPGAFDNTFNGGDDVALIKLNPAGSALAYSTFLGGGRADEPLGVTVDGGGNAYVTGRTISTNFPTTAGAFQGSYPGQYGDLPFDAAFMTKVNAAGSALVYSTYLGSKPGGTIGKAVVADDAGNAYMTGLTRATGFPTTAGAYDTTFNAGGGLFSSNGASAFVTKFGASGSMSYSTFLGTTTYYEMDIGIDSGRNAVAMGLTYDRAFPTTPGAFDPTNGPDGSDLFVAKLNASGSALSYSTYLGVGNEERPGAMAIDSDGNAIVRGFTLSDSYPTTPGAYDSTFNSFSTQAFVTKLDLLPTFFAFGNASVGGSFSPLSANTKRASPFTLFRNATIRRVYAYIDGKGATSGQQTLRAVVYRNAGGPAARAALSFDFTVKAGDPGHWQPFYLAPPVALGPGVYWLALQGGSADGVARVAWSSKPNSRRFNADSFGDGPSDPYGASTADEQQLSIYAAE